ncbi:MAG: hypothetical protein GX605_09780, partial [Chloroflexi bacterium]|nr:hypothetical protein [Chloroflexota bacterium]
VRAKLESAGIPATLSYSSGSTVFAVTVDGLGEVRVLVPASLAQEAMEFLQETVELDGDPDLPEVGFV